MKPTGEFRELQPTGRRSPAASTPIDSGTIDAVSEQLDFAWRAAVPAIVLPRFRLCFGCWRTTRFYWFGHDEREK
jgi:hypothetical protein